MLPSCRKCPFSPSCELTCILAKEARPMHCASSLGSLRNNDTVAIVGGGPAGSFFAIHLLREARRLNRHIDVVIVEKRGLIELGRGALEYKGCTFCAGGISPRLDEILEEHDLSRSGRDRPRALRLRLDTGPMEKLPAPSSQGQADVLRFPGLVTQQTERETARVRWVSAG